MGQLFWEFSILEFPELALNHDCAGSKVLSVSPEH